MTRPRFTGDARAPRCAHAAGPRRKRPRTPRGSPCEPLEPRTLLAVFTVTTTDDAGPGSLRQAILDANAAPDLDQIRFNLPGDGVHTIRPLSPLPPVTEFTWIDARTQPGYSDGPLVEIDGSLAGPDADGFTLRESSSSLSGFAINRFSRHGVVVGSADDPAHATVLGFNHIGTSPSGAAPGNGGAGVYIANGFETSVLDNSITNNALGGIVVFSGSGNRVVNNTISNNALGGIIVQSGRGNFVSGGAFDSNGGRPIDLAPGGVLGTTPNDTRDPDAGPNDLQNFPLVNWATTWPTTGTTVSFSLNSRPSRRYRVELYSNGNAVAVTSVTTDRDGNATGVFRLPPAASPTLSSTRLTTTATDLTTNETSEFSAGTYAMVTPVIAGYFFYNNSAYDNRDPSANAADDAAIAPDKTPTYNVNTSMPLNFTNYDKGINGVMLDVVGLPPGDNPVTAQNFRFVFWDKERSGGLLVNRVRPAPTPSSVSVRRGAGVGGSDRVTITWPDGAIRNGWLGVGYSQDGKSYPFLGFGNLAGDAGGVEMPNGLGKGSIFSVNALDLAATRARLGSGPVGITSPYDFNRDGRIDALDVAVVRSNLGAVLALYRPVGM